MHTAMQLPSALSILMYLTNKKPFLDMYGEAARSKVDVSEAMQAEIIYYKLDYIDLKLITTENTVSSYF